MNEIVNKVLLVQDQFMHEIHLRQPFTKNKEIIQKFTEYYRILFFTIFLPKRTR